MQSEQRFGAECDLRSHLLHCLDDGVNLCLSVDATSAASVNPFENMSIAWYIRHPLARYADRIDPSRELRQCLEMATINGARAMGLEDQVGSLMPGKRADLIMIRATDLNMAPFGGWTVRLCDRRHLRMSTRLSPTDDSLSGTAS